ncbi:MAG: hypothetical protein JNK60_09525 [Acidobacteria bacterium]|nr:hypothetical protein [Acidobacteriota bacterium]
MESKGKALVSSRRARNTVAAPRYAAYGVLGRLGQSVRDTEWIPMPEEPVQAPSAEDPSGLEAPAFPPRPTDALAFQPHLVPDARGRVRVEVPTVPEGHVLRIFVTSDALQQGFLELTREELGELATKRAR